jgi:ligand-binding sensor domain-containing protein
MDIYEDPNGTLWMGSVVTGWFCFDRYSGRLSIICPTLEQLAFPFFAYVSCIQGDAQGYLWMGTILGLAALLIHVQ